MTSLAFTVLLAGLIAALCAGYPHLTYAPKMFYIQLSFINSGPSVVVKWTQNGKPKKLNIPSGYNYRQSISFESVTRPSAMQFRIYKAGTKNVVKIFDVMPTLQQGKAKVIKIGAGGSSYGGHGGNSGYGNVGHGVVLKYHIDLSFFNWGPNVVVKWTQNGKPKELNIHSGYTYQQPISFKSGTPPSAIRFSIYKAGTKKIVRSFDVMPTLQHGKAKVIKIGSVPKYYIGLTFINSGPSVVVKWTQNGKPKELNIHPGYTYHQSISFQSSAPPSAIQFTIYKAGTKKVVQSFDVMPTLQHGKAKVIRISAVHRLQSE